jgi:hypothetical protein
VVAAAVLTAPACLRPGRMDPEAVLRGYFAKA